MLSEKINRCFKRIFKTAYGVDCLIESHRRLEDGLQRIDEGLERIDGRLERLEEALDRKFPEVDVKVKEATPEKFLRLRNKYLGERCFLLGTAPSLSELDLSALIGERIFSVNGGIKLIGHPFKSLVGYCVADPIFYRDHKNEIDTASIDHLFISSTVNISEKKHLDSACIFDSCIRPRMHQGMFQFDLTQPTFSSHTVMHHALQILVYMGFRKIYLAGIDLSFGTDEPHFYTSTEREVRDSANRSAVHAHKMLEGFYKANRILSERGIKVVNLSSGGALKDIERDDLNTVLGREVASASKV